MLTTGNKPTVHQLTGEWINKLVYLYNGTALSNKE